ncbi:hypothetical protein BHM03_00050388 [Ensete ventricosum]|nr:hypothetical protein BHM03_00050388 [Ensete ventricosum]
MHTTNYFLLINDCIFLLDIRLYHYCYSLDPLLYVLSKQLHKYHDLLVSDYHREVSETLTGVKFNDSMNVLLLLDIDISL